MTESVVLLSGEGRHIDLGDFAVTVKATEGDTDGALSLLEADEPPGFGPPLHIHHDAGEAFYVLEGEYIFFLAGREVRCAPGSFVYIPAGVEHGFRVGDVQSRKLNIYVPAAMIGFFDEMGKPGQLSEAEVVALARKYSMEITGPVPEGYG